MAKTRCSTTSEQDTQPSVGQFTPGPWSASQTYPPGDWCIHARGIPWQLAYLRRHKNHAWPLEANASLIAAAPDLYRALLAAQEELRLIRMKDHGTVYNPALSTQIALALQKAVPQTVLGTPDDTSNTESSPNTTVADPEPGR